MSWSVAGTYLESCNCDAICPCRTIGGRPGGRSTHGICFGVLSWLIQDGQADGVDLSGLTAALTYSYDDDVPRSPWQLVVYVDSRGSEERRDALTAILLGQRGGDDILRLPWVRKPSEVVEIRARPIEIHNGPTGHELRIGSAVQLSATKTVATDERVSCIVPGHHVPGQELYADRLAVADGPFEWELADNCAFVSTFEYTSEPASHQRQ